MIHHRARVARPIAALAAALTVLAGAATASAHESDAVSDPPSGSVVDEAITEVTIEFGPEISDDVELALFGPGDDEVVEPTTTTKIAPNAARIEFDPLEEQGTYVVRYLTVAPADGHTIVGAVSFTYGSEGGGNDLGSWLWFLLAMIPILAVGTAWSYRLHRRQRAERAAAADDGADGTAAGDRGAAGSDVDEDLPDVRV